jgi:hypothetical protein
VDESGDLRVPRGQVAGVGHERGLSLEEKTVQRTRTNTVREARHWLRGPVDVGKSCWTAFEERLQSLDMFASGAWGQLPELAEFSQVVRGNLAQQNVALTVEVLVEPPEQKLIFSYRGFAQPSRRFGVLYKLVRRLSNRNRSNTGLRTRCLHVSGTHLSYLPVRGVKRFLYPFTADFPIAPYRT